MPFFQYVCSDCGNAFDKPDDKNAGAANCPACGSTEIKTTSGSCTPKG